MSAGVDELTEILVLGQEDPPVAQSQADDVGIVSAR